MQALVRHGAVISKRACRLLVKAYANGAESHHVDWEDIDIAHDAAQSALAVAGEQP